MANAYQNIIGSTATRVNGIVRNHSVNCLKLCNIHASDAVVLDLYITYTERDKSSDNRQNIGDNGNWDALTTITNTYYILKNISIPKGVTLVLDNKELSFDVKRYDLYIKLDQSDSTVDIIVDTEIV
jgi:hypothetical protein